MVVLESAPTVGQYVFMYEVSNDMMCLPRMTPSLKLMAMLVIV